MIEPATEVEELARPLDDPLLCDHDFPLRARFFPLGFPVELETNSHHVLSAATESWGLFPPTFSRPPLKIEIGVAESRRAAPPKPPSFRSRGHMMSIVADSDNFSHSDWSRGFAYGWVTRNVAADREFFRYHFLEPTVLTLLEQKYLAPIHCAFIVRHGRGVALCGESSAGKSTLAFACARAGWTFVADDAIYLLRNEPKRYALGNPHVIRFRASATKLFSELKVRRPATRQNGKFGFELQTKELGLEIATGNRIDHLVFLSRREGASAQIERFPAHRALTAMKQFLNHGEAWVRSEQARCYERLLETGAWLLVYSGLDDAIRQLDELVEYGI
jgi:hypothetical protein